MLFKKLGKKMTSAKIEEAMRELDADGNGEVSFPEFKHWWDQNGGALNLRVEHCETTPGMHARYRAG